MGTKAKALTAGTKGLIATTAGLVTVAVGLLTIGGTLGWFDGGGTPAPEQGPTPTTVAGTGPSSNRGTGASSNRSSSPTDSSAEPTSSPEWDVEPTALKLSLTTPEGVVTLRNTGAVAFAVDDPKIGGTDGSEFKVEKSDCGSRLLPGGICQVTIVPRTPGTYNAKLVIPLAGGEGSAEVPITSSPL